MAVVYRDGKWFAVGRVRGGAVPIADQGYEMEAPPSGCTIYQGLSDVGAGDALDRLGIKWDRTAAMDPAWTTIQVAGGAPREYVPPKPYRVRCVNAETGKVEYDIMAV